MTLEELRDRIKNEVVLHEGELADWQWRQKGLVAEASELGITDFTRLVNDISRQVNRDFGKILDLKKKIVTVALQRQHKLTAADMTQFVMEAERVQLSRTFVVDQWIPAILEALPASVEPEPVLLPENPPSVVSAGTAPPPPNPSEPAPSTDKVESVRKKIKSILDDYDKHIQAQSLNFLFKAVDYDEAALAEEIRRYLSEHYYASVHPPRGTTLKEKLISTDWRHLSWWEKDQSKPADSVKTPVGYTTSTTLNAGGTPHRPPAMPLPVSEKPPGHVPPAVQPTEPPKKSGLSDVALILLAVLSALILIWVVLRLTRGTEEEEAVPKPPKSSKNQSLDPGRKGKPAKPPKTGLGGKKKLLPEEERPESASSTDKTGKNRPGRAGEIRTVDFDEVDNTVGEFGLRPARKGGWWGFVDESNTWVIEPQFELATPFNNGKASVELDGNQFFIDRYGKRIREGN
ncbi:WG repeat-containing protein [Larkinella bovis]|uniref:WG repeat-containing protein n=1 Tax=Larkinella bovis TaxID=683041 RepID=A0ABW0ID73_9BACT